MPDTETLLDMYGTSYFDEVAHPDRFNWIVPRLNGGGVFLDYGCGAGDLLSLVNQHGYKPIGVEFNPETIKHLRQKLPFEFLSPDDETEPADVLHLGDVIEHLTDINLQLPRILSRLKPGGTLIAHNPLEGNSNLFASAMRLSRKLRGGVVDGVPYHVTLATTKGQKTLFQRMRLKEISFAVEEIPFPAPYTLKEAKGLKPLSLYGLRKASQAVSRLTGIQRSGNRYRYIGQKL
jgi:SAM-dependent methyltransferase